MKLFNRHILISMILVFITLVFAPFILDIKFFAPIKRHFSDFELIDVGYPDFGEFETADSNIFLVNTIYKDTVLNNRMLADIIEWIQEYKPKVIAIEKPLEHSNNNEDDFYLDIVLSKYNNIVIGTEYIDFSDTNEAYIKKKVSDNIFSNVKITGYNNVLVDKNKKYYKVREFFPYYKFNNNLDTSLIIKILEIFDKTKLQKFLNRNNEKEIISFRGTYKNFGRCSFDDIINNQVNPEVFRDKIILFGKFQEISSALPCLFNDIYFTPLNKIQSSKTFPDMYSIEIQANIISMIVNEKYIYIIPAIINILIAILFTYINILIFYLITQKNIKLYEISNLLIFLFESFGIFYITIYLFHSHNIKIDLTLTLFAIILTVFVYEGYDTTLKPIIDKIVNKFKTGRVVK